MEMEDEVEVLYGSKEIAVYQGVPALSFKSSYMTQMLIDMDPEFPITISRKEYDDLRAQVENYKKSSNEWFESFMELKKKYQDLLKEHDVTPQ